MTLPDHWDIEADIVVIGFGAASVAASVTACERSAAAREAVAQAAWE